MTDNGPSLVADIGATYARFALALADGSVNRTRVMSSDDHRTLSDAIEAYLREESPPRRPQQAALAVAAPVTGDRIAMTNHPWAFSIDELRRQFGLRRLHVVNDFAANALAIPHLAESDRIQVGSGRPIAEAPIAVIGPGSGLGVGALVHCRGRYLPIQGEGGHATMAAADADESAVLELLRRRFDHVSAERVLSGPGLINLYNALCELSGARAAQLTPAQITDAQLGREDRNAHRTTAMFCAMLGTVAGNLALTLGARGGVYVAGGIAPKLGSLFVQSAFRERFEAKGRFRNYLAAIPTYVIVRPLPALLGLARLLQEE